MIDNYKTNQPILMIWGQCTCLLASFSSRIRFSGFRDHKIFLNWYRDDFSSVVIDISFFAHNFFIFENFSKFPISYPHKFTIPCIYVLSSYLNFFWGKNDE